jgi:uncharacterized protein YndB with AHSA1/START domain
MRFYEATSTNAAGPDAVWAVLTDGASWAAWDSGVVGVEGRIAPGERIKIRTEVAPGRTFPVTVTTFEAPQRLAFTGGMPLGLFRGVRTYTLTPEPGGGTAFFVREEYTGLLLGLLWRSMPDLGPSFEKFAHGLKQRVESGAAP